MILIAIRDDELKDVVEAALEHYGSPYPCRIVKSVQEVQAALQTQAVRCLVMTVDVALAGDDGRGGLLQQLPPKFPTVTLIGSGDGFPAYLYDPQMFHDWCTIPFGLDELFGRVDRVVRRAEKAIAEREGRSESSPDM